MTLNGPSDPGNTTDKNENPSISRVRNAVILPDGTKKEPLGSGVITGLLGIGGMANVYEIWNGQLEVARAVKLLHPNYTEETRQRFQTEIKITAKLHHRNIIEIHAVGHWNGLPFIEMERIQGETLEKILEQRGALPVDVCTSIGIMMGRALWYAHNQEYVIYGTTYHGVIHRDLKPSNIMVTNEGVVKLMDFGIARPTDASIHTTDGAILGTMQYLSPEQLDGKDPDIRTDIYSLGTILYELLTGIKAFPEHNISKLMLSKIKNNFKPLDQFDTKIPSRLRRLVHRCMVYERDKRIPDAQVFLSEISKIHHSGSGNSPEQVLKRFLNEEGSERTIVAPRRTLPKQAIIVGVIMLLLSFGIWLAERSIQHRVTGNDRKLQEPPRIPEQHQVIPDEKKVPSDKLPEQRQETATGVKKGKMEMSTAVRQTTETGKKAVSLSSPPSLLEQLKTRYATDNLLTIFTGEVQKRHFKEALQVFDALPPADAASARAVVYKVRSLRALGRLSDLRAFLAQSTVTDGELYLERAKLAFKDNDLAAALAHLKSCERTAGAFMESGELRLERLYLEAHCAGRQFDRDQSETSRRLALDRWYEVKLELRTARDHPYFKEADEQMQRITNK